MEGVNRDYSKMTVVELGNSNAREAIPFIKKFLLSNKPNDKRLAASAINKLCLNFEEECRVYKDILLENLNLDYPQVRKYSLKALSKMKLNKKDLIYIYELHKKEDRDYNIGLIRYIINKYKHVFKKEKEKDTKFVLRDLNELFEYSVEDYESMTIVELGNSGKKEAIPFIKRYLLSPKANDKKLAASAINKLCANFEEECREYKDILLANLNLKYPQVREYTLKALSKMVLKLKDLEYLVEIYNKEDKVYNKRLIKDIIYNCKINS